MVLHKDSLFTQLLGGICGWSDDVYHGSDPGQLRDWLSGSKRKPRLALLDIESCACRRRRADAILLMQALMGHEPEPAVLLVCAEHDAEMTNEAHLCGIHQLLHRPCTREQILEAVSTLRLRHEAVVQRQDQTPISDACSQQQQATRNLIARFASLPYPVLVSGESGTGKEAVARGLHHEGRRHCQPFLSINCAAIADSLIDSVLFGHARGAFTGAQRDRAGMFEDAGRGTLFLDEIGEMPMALQAKLLRVLENGEFVRVGETRPRFSTARIVAATNRDLEACVSRGEFRSDLFHRLSVLAIRVAPLRERRADKMALWTQYVAMMALQMECLPCQLSPDAMHLWMEYDFPGNVRELRNIVIRLLVQHSGDVISAASLRCELINTAVPPAAVRTGPGVQGWLDQPDFDLDRTLRQVQGQLIHDALQRSHGNVSAAARLLGVRRTTLYGRMAEPGPIV